MNIKHIPSKALYIADKLSRIRLSNATRLSYDREEFILLNTIPNDPEIIAWIKKVKEYLKDVKVNI